MDRSNINIHESLEKRIFEAIRISDIQKSSIWGALVVGLIAHLYQLTNMLSNGDHIMLYYNWNPYDKMSLWGGASSTRVLTASVDLVAYWFKTPVVVGTIILSCMIASSMLVTELYGIKSKTGGFWVGAIIASFPTVLAYMSLNSAAYAVSAFLFVLVTYMIEKSERFPYFSIVIITIAFAIFSTNVMCLLIIGIVCLIKRTLENEVIDYSSYWRYVVRYVIVGLLGMFFLLLLTKIVLSILGIGMTSYQGADQLLSVSSVGDENVDSSLWLFELLKKYANNAIAATKTTMRISVSNMAQIPELKFTLYVAYAIMLIAVLKTTISKGRYKSITRMSIVVVAIILLILSLSIMSLVSPQFAYRGQHRMQWAFLFAATIICVEVIIEIIGNKKRLAIAFWCFAQSLIALLVYGFVLYDNVGYFNQQYVMEKDSSTLIRILSYLDGIYEFDYANNPVYVWNYATSSSAEETLSPLGIVPELYEVASPDADTNLWCWGDSTFKAHALKYEGVKLLEPSAEVKNRIMEQGHELYTQYAEDLSYGDFVIIKYEDTDTYVVLIKTQIYSVLY